MYLVFVPISLIKVPYHHQIIFTQKVTKEKKAPHYLVTFFGNLVIQIMGSLLRSLIFCVRYPTLLNDWARIFYQRISFLCLPKSSQVKSYSIHQLEQINYEINEAETKQLNLQVEIR